MKNASLITEVEDLNRKVREMLEQVREKDRQISKLQGNYSKVRHIMHGSRTPLNKQPYFVVAKEASARRISSSNSECGQ
jgi:hypothetical protein